MRPVILLAVLGTLTGAARLDAAPPPAYDDAPLRAVRFVDANEGWAVGDDGLVLHTTDGGKSWERQKTGTRASLRAVQFLTPYTGWVAGRIDGPSGSSGVLLKTDDGGMTWGEVAGGLLPGLGAVHFTDDKKGFVCGDGSNATPAGVFATTDGGDHWTPAAGPRTPGWAAAAFAPTGELLLAGAWGKLARLDHDGLMPADAPDLGGRAVHAVALPTNPRMGKGYSPAVACGAGGLILTSTTGGRQWAVCEPPLPPAARAACDFRCVAARGDKLWVAGSPGSVVLHSPDAGKTWQAHKTGVTAPLHGLCMVSDTHGWAVGDLGTVLGTADGGKTWNLLRSGGQRAAVLFAHAANAGVPAAALPVVGGKDGYLTAAVTLTSADPMSADPARASDADRLAAAVRSAGGVAAESVWGFPLPAHCDGLPPDQVLAYWDGLHGGKARDHLLRRLVLAVRTWRPEVIVSDLLDPAAPAAEQAMLYAVQEAFKMAADPAAFPEQLDALGLSPHAAKKLYARAPAAAQVAIDATAYRPEIADTPAVASESAATLLGTAPAGVLHYRLVSHRLPGSESHANLTDGCDLARGGTARRREGPALNPAYVTMREGVARGRKQLAELTAPATFDADGDAALARVIELLKTMPDSDAGAAAVAAAAACARAGRWTAARELYLLAATTYVAQPSAVEASRWLVRYHASGEALRRVERGQHPVLRKAAFVVFPPKPPEGVVQASYTEPGGSRARFRSGEAERQWVGTAPDLLPLLAAANPAAVRDPAVQLAVAAGRMRLGLTADAERGLAPFRRAGTNDPWADAVGSELWLANRGLAAAPPKPLAGCPKTATRPTLDGKLDDDCWKTATPLPVVADWAKEYPTEAKFAFDGEFLYVAVTCGHPAAEPAAKATKRRRDEDLRGKDRVDILLDLDRDFGTYFRFQIDARGCVAEDCSGDSSWNPKWFVAAEPTATGWSAEAAIPLAELTGTPPRDGHVWAANVVRVLPGRGVLGWSGPADARPRPEGLGLVEFRGK